MSFITFQDVCLRHELLQYMSAYVNDDSESSKPSWGETWGSLLALKCLVWFMKYYANVRRTVADFSHAPLNEYSPSPDDKKQWSLVWFDFYKIPLCTLMTSRRLSKLEYKFQDKENSEDIFSFGSALEDFISVVFVPDRNIYSTNMRRTDADFSHAPLNEYSPSPDDKKQWSLGCWFGGKLIQKLRQKGVYEESFSRHAAWIGGKLIQFMHTTMVPVQVKTMKIQAGVQVSRQGELRRHLQLWKCFGRLYFYTHFVEYTRIEVKHFRDTLFQHLRNVKKSVSERTRHQRQYERMVNKRQMQTLESKIDTGKALDNSLVVMKRNGTESEVQDDSSRSGNDTDADDADIRPIYDEEPMAEVHITAECNIFSIGQQHTKQPEIIVEGRVDQYPETCQVKSPMLDSSPDNQTTEYSKQSLESENILLKKTVAQFQKDFSRMEAHCIALELKYQNQALKSGQHGQILNETSNKAKIEKEIDVLETMNIELEHSVAKLRKENETLKQHYKDLYDSIKITRSKTTEQTTSLLANNAELKAQIQEKVFAIAALKNDLRKLKGNSVDTKFDKTSVLGKPVLPSLRNQSVVRQPNAFKSERAQMSKQRFASQVDVNKNLSKPVTQHYLPKKTESAFAKPDHMIASSSSRNSSKNMPRFSSNDMVHNHYLDVAKKKIQERDRNSTTSVTTSARIQTTADDSKPKPRSNNQTSRSLPFMHTTMVPVQVKTMKIQAGIQVSRPRELTRQLQLWKCFGDFISVGFVPVRCDKNIMKVKGFMWCMQKAMARSRRFGTLVETSTSMDGHAGLVLGRLGLALGTDELAQRHQIS
ncbi:hypothetical protein Tco_1112375 [Tanacetum coccineum]|uniref:Aminotransferase-like plant mobile domain-containing protein n=1 Tax=Tanacetum coccineum TaxID=301880 RepID=A0ABQ5IP94_9ASTR